MATNPKTADAPVGIDSRESRFLEQIVEAADLHFWLMKLDPFELLYATPATLEAWGLGTADSSEPAPRVHPDDLGVYADLFTASGGQAREAEYRVVLADGKIVWRHSRVFPIRDEAGHVVRIAGVTADVTTRKEAEHELTAHRALERLLTTLSSKLIQLEAGQMDEAFRTALADLSAVIEADQAGIALMDEADKTLKIRWEWHHPDAEPALPENFNVVGEEAFLSELAKGEFLTRRAVTALPEALSDSRERLAAHGIQSIVDAPIRSQGVVIGFLGFASTKASKIWPSELTQLVQIAGEMFASAIEKVRSEKAVRTQRDQLARVQRLGTMGQLASGIAHELNQPLAAILNYAAGCERHIAQGRVDAEALRPVLRAIGEQATRAARVITSLRTLVKAASRRERCDANALVRDALRLIEPEAVEKATRIVFEGAEGLPEVQVDEPQIQQVLLNLVQNAIDAIDAASPAHRVVRIRTHRADADSVEISVEDSGHGVEPSNVHRLFDDFFTTKAQGLGLGLSISRSLVEAHGGCLSYAGYGARGACFRFTLPAAPVIKKG